MESVLDRVRQTIEQHCLLRRSEAVVVGVSGGPDSLCLLHLLGRLRSEYDLKLHVAHLHHGLRGAEADADAEFVGTLATEWRLPCTVEQIDVRTLAREQKLAFEEAARRARYTFLSQVAETVGAATIAVGHNADDQAETVLMHYLRGSGMAGLRGMLLRTPLTDYRLTEMHKAQSVRRKAQRPIPNPESTTPPLPQPTTPHLIRPLLEVTRTEIEAYCDHYDLEPRFDRSNLDTTYFRNWLRHEVLPLLAEHNPNVREVIRRSARVIADEYELLRALLLSTWAEVVLEEGLCCPAGGRIAFDLAAWRGLPTALQRSTLREAIHRLRRSLRNINFLHVENALQVARDGTTGDQATLPRGLMLTVGYSRFTVADAGAGDLVPDWPLLPAEGRPLALTIPGETALPGSGWLVRAELLEQAELPHGWQDNADPWLVYLDAQVVGPAPLLRTRQTGDRFQPLGLGGHHAKLADFLTNQKVPRAARDRLPLLVGEGGFAWVCGFRVDERARVGAETGQVLMLRFVAQRAGTQVQGPAPPPAQGDAT